MIEFFRDVLDGPLYIVIVVLCIIFIMAIIGFLMERKKLEKEAKEKIAVVDNVNPVEPIKPVEVQEEMTPIEISEEIVPIKIPEEPELTDINQPNINIQPEVNGNITQPNIQPEKANSFNEVKKPVYIFEDPDQKKE